MSLKRQLYAAPLRRLQASSQSVVISESYFKRALTLHLDLQLVLAICITSTSAESAWRCQTSASSEARSLRQS
jgi:hypothetical protein